MSPESMGIREGVKGNHLLVWAPSSFQQHFPQFAYPITYALILLSQNPLLKGEIKICLNMVVTWGLLFLASGLNSVMEGEQQEPQSNK